MLANSRNRVRRAVLGPSQDGACTNLCDNFREISLKRDLSNDTTVNPPLFSLVNTFIICQIYGSSANVAICGFAISGHNLFCDLKLPLIRKYVLFLLTNVAYNFLTLICTKF